MGRPRAGAGRGADAWPDRVARAPDVGYDDTEANFSNLFRDWCGLHPSPYRDLASELRQRCGLAPEEVFTWGLWRRLYCRELDAAQAETMIRFLEAFIPSMLGVLARQRRRAL